MARRNIALILLALAAVARGDSTVVFNEVMYHPQTDEASFEWIELRNQMAVDMDISGWSLAEGVDFVFPEGTVMPGGGYLVVAVNPAALMAATSATNVLGPFTGRLNNGGEKLELRNNNQRLMDELEYGTEKVWPVAPDGAGPSLAKIDENGATADPANWRSSRQMGGSPGTVNTPAGSPIVNLTTVPLDATWRCRAIGSPPSVAWNTPAYDDSSWNTGQALFYGGTAGWRPAETQAVVTLYNSGVNAAGQALSAGQPDPHYVLTASAHSTPPPPAISATVMANHSAWLANDATSCWIGPVADGYASIAPGRYQFRTTFDLSGMDTNTAIITLQMAADNRVTNVFLNGEAKGFSYVGYNPFSSPFSISSGFVSGINTLDFDAFNDGSSANPGGFRVKASGTAGRLAPTNTVLATGADTRYFRTTFVANGDPSTAMMTLRTVVDDGAVFYLNGVEVLRLNMPAGPIAHATAASTNVGNAVFAGPFSLPVASLVNGTNVFAVELHQAADGASDVMFGAELSLSITNDLLPWLPALALNELPCVTNQVFWAEIVNYGSQHVNLSNFILKRFGNSGGEYTIPAQIIPPGGYALVHRADTGFGADPGDMLVLYTPGQATAVDAVVAKHYPRARWPEGQGAWRFPAMGTPGATNRVDLRGDIVFNEIMYHPRDPQGPATNSPEQWVELYNRGTGTVDLTDWRLEIDGKKAFRFPAGQTLMASNYLVVARDAAFLRGLYPAINIIGDLTKRLPGQGGMIELYDGAGLPLDPVVDPDVAGNLVDVVCYGDSRPWPAYPDGLGASLELRDPRADNSRPEAWAASDDRASSAWQTYTYRGTATVETASSPTQWKEFVLGLIGAGEVLLDDISVIDSPAGAATQLIQNGAFETGASAWRIIGNHRHSEVIVDPDNAANHVLRLVAEGYAEHMHNHAETTLAGGASVVNGREYQISFRAKWVAGCNRLNTRLYFNRLARLTEIAAPALNGTPGARNSQVQANLGPTFCNLAHQPVVPVSGQPVSVSVSASDPDGLSTGTLYYAVNSGAWQSVPMNLRAATTGSGATLDAVVPGQASGSVVQFYVEAEDALGVKAVVPPDGTNSRALFAVSAGKAILSRLHTIRIVMTPADAAYLHGSTNVMSNERLGCTLIADERSVAYDAGVHLQGSERGRNDASRVGFTVRLPFDRPYRGVLDGFTVDRSGGYSGKGGDPDEILLKHAINKAGGLPGMYDDLCQVFAPRASDDGTGLLILAKYDKEFLDSQYKDGGDGEMFKLELVYYPTSTTTGDVQAPKLPQPDGALGTDIRDLGNNPESYRWTFLKENHTARNNYAPMVALAKAFSLTGAALDTQTRQLMDVDEWMRAVAFLSLIGGSDMYTYGNSHNLIIYFRPEDGKGMAFPWDLDFSFVDSVNAAFPGSGSANTSRIINLPGNLHAYYGHLYDLSGVTGDSVYMGRWATHYAGLVSQNWGAAVTYLKNRADYVRSQLPISTPFAITNNLGNDFGVINSTVTLGGTGPITVKSITVNGVTYPVTWTGATVWNVSLPLPAYTNRFTLQAYDLHGQLLADAWDEIAVINTGMLAPQPVVINEWMADNSGPGGFPDPVDLKYQDWFELYNPNDLPVNLSGYTLTDDLAAPAKWTIPTNTTIAAHGFLLVWADEEPAQNGMGSYGDLHASFKLSNSGESLGLFSPTGVRQHALTFGAQSQNVSQGLYPDASTNTFYSMTNWTPRATNRFGSPTLTTVVVAPASANVMTNGTQLFAATAFDQFGAALTVQPAFVWTVVGGGTIQAGTGLFTAAGAAGGPYTVTATSGGKSGMASVSVSATANAAPMVVTAAVATPNPVTGTTAALSVLGADDGGEAGLTYTWAITGSPPAPVTFSVNGNNAAKSTTATFAQAGSYTLQVQIRDAGNLAVFSSVNVTVNGVPVAPSRTDANALPYRESFEDLTAWGGLYTRVHITNGWYSSDSGRDQSAITNLAYAYTGTWPIHAATHTNVLLLNTLDATLTNLLEDASFAAANVYVDVMVQMIASEDRPARCTTLDTGTKAAFYANASSNLMIYHGVLDAGTGLASNIVDAIANTPRLNAAGWYRLTLDFQHVTNAVFGLSMFQVQLDGVTAACHNAYADDWKTEVQAGRRPATSMNGTWFLSATRQGAATAIAALGFQGAGYLDDLTVARDVPFWQPPSFFTITQFIGPHGHADPPGTFTLPSGASTTILYTASPWYRIETLTADGAPVVAAAGRRVYTQALVNAAADGTNCVAFVAATPAQAGLDTNIAVSWASIYYASEEVAAADGNLALDYLLDQAPSNNYIPVLTSRTIAMDGTNVGVVVGLSGSGLTLPTTIHGTLKLKRSSDLRVWTDVGSAVSAGATFAGGGNAAPLWFVSHATNEFYQAEIVP